MIWSALDTFFTQQLTPLLPAFNTMMPVAIQDVREWEMFATPALLIMSQDALRQYTRHGDGVPHLDKTYPYLFIVLAQGTPLTSLTEAKERTAELEYQLIRLNVQGIVSGDERARRLRVRDSRVTTFRKAGSQSDLWYTAVGTLVVVEAYT